MSDWADVTTSTEHAGPAKGSRLAIRGAGVLAVVAVPMMALPIPDPVRAVLAVTALWLAPGYAVAYLARMHDPLSSTMIMLSVGLSLNVVVALVLLYAGWWGSMTYVAVTGLITLCLVILALRTEHPRWPLP